MSRPPTEVPGAESGMHNVEYKAELRDRELARAVCRNLGATYIATLEQTDTYYRVPTGRLKRRECLGEPTEWIFYDRKDESRARLSCFTIYSESQARDRFGTQPLPQLVVVQKVRELYLFENVRLHLDDVRDLGRFIEFEALVSPGHPVASCHTVVERLRSAFGPLLGEPLSCSYSDLRLQEPDPSDSPTRR